ncbi:hypothetical protein [Bryobacter aggregatus]|uniref:hypothetical protein n=1 Tax=Bryobacter aggregatus TaxID=360054 RepID=UPI0012BA6B48|nr:hypothetical protein [Bryobacter aggregatus]
MNQLVSAELDRRDGRVLDPGRLSYVHRVASQVGGLDVEFRISRGVEASTEAVS